MDATAAHRQLLQEAVEKLVLELSCGEKRVGSRIKEVAREVGAVEKRLGARMDEVQAQGRRIEGALEGGGRLRCVFVLWWWRWWRFGFGVWGVTCGSLDVGVWM